ncbi:hypothetical protein HNQ07_000918 [Deinococcus metalli]|uniref:Uncharacterized protein n=1 Tax=Deinococcus metalli TaxID=1141878 RepID=A0A7W8KC57_9DEIO|nr:hypothetical protein [Deinococcus metalli]MBB5375474.1 hypothetical protein [Deinococcus metalli]GHF29011.1 hypothetical protein GCM10017781_01220 [Deinococcus metalli]
MIPAVDHTDVPLFCAIQCAEAQAFAEVRPQLGAGRPAVEQLHAAIAEARLRTRQDLLVLGYTAEKIDQGLQRYDTYLAAMYDAFPPSVRIEVMNVVPYLRR